MKYQCHFIENKTWHRHLKMIVKNINQASDPEGTDERFERSDSKCYLTGKATQ